jgi:hypothetical protein
MDYINYSTDAATRAAYVAAGGTVVYGSDICSGGTASADGYYDDGWGTTYPAANAFDNNESTYWQSAVSGAYPHWLKYDLGSGKTKTVQKLRVKSGAYTGGGFVFAGSNDNSTWTTLYSGTMLSLTSWQEFTFSNSTAYRYYRIYWSFGWIDSNVSVSEVEMLEYLTPWVFSESVIKQEGEYSMRGNASSTNVSASFTRTLSSTLNLSDRATIRFGLRSSRTGSNIKLGIHDSGGTTSETTPNITSAGVWQTVDWDISAVANANKDVIDQIIISVVDFAADTIFYIDNMRALGTYYPNAKPVIFR